MSAIPRRDILISYFNDSFSSRILCYLSRDVEENKQKKKKAFRHRLSFYFHWIPLLNQFIKLFFHSMLFSSLYHSIQYYQCIGTHSWVLPNSVDCLLFRIEFIAGCELLSLELLQLMIPIEQWKPSNCCRTQAGWLIPTRAMLALYTLLHCCTLAAHRRKAMWWNVHADYYLSCRLFLPIFSNPITTQFHSYWWHTHTHQRDTKWIRKVNRKKKMKNDDPWFRFFFLLISCFLVSLHCQRWN